jgi:stalled ribosome alternative rescue factor ArfA
MGDGEYGRKETHDGPDKFAEAHFLIHNVLFLRNGEYRLWLG